MDLPGDVAKVYLGVEAREETVAESREAAADTVERVLDAIRALGIDDDDIVTTSFNIHPQTVLVEVTDSAGRHSACSSAARARSLRRKRDACQPAI